MKPSAMKTVIIRHAVEKGIKDIKDNPKRGIRNLIELGEMFAGGRFQKEFFNTAMAQLRDEESAYYRIVEQVVQQTDAEALTSFGINLGYNALSHGASIIRNIEETEGFNIPWCLTVDVGCEKSLLPFDIESIIEDGKELGIYCYLIYVDVAYPDIHELMEVFEREKECAFILFIHPEAITSSFTESLSRNRHVAVMMDLDAPDDEKLRHAANQLLLSGNVCGGFSRAEALEPDEVSSDLLKYPKSLGLAIMVFARTKKHHPALRDDVYSRVVQLRETLAMPVVPIDLYEDMAHADRAISSEACLVAVTGDGSLTLADMETREKVTGYNIHNISLGEALRKAMPKTGNKTIAALA